MEGPYSQLILSDLEEHPVPQSVQDGTIAEGAEIRRVALYDQRRRNVQTLTDHGARGPFIGVTGFECTQFITPAQLVGDSQTIKLALWGSPHWGTKTYDATASFADSGQFKTNAFESMSWNCNSAVVVMAWSNPFQVEFWNPNYRRLRRDRDDRVKRKLLVGSAYFRSYIPVSSGPSLDYIGNNSRPIGTMETSSAATDCSVALLVPHEYMNCVTCRDDGNIDVGMTMWRILQQLGRQEWAVELGGQTYSFGYEIHLARLDAERNARLNAGMPAAASGNADVDVYPDNDDYSI